MDHEFSLVGVVVETVDVITSYKRGPKHDPIQKGRIDMWRLLLSSPVPNSEWVDPVISLFNQITYQNCSPSHTRTY